MTAHLEITGPDGQRRTVPVWAGTFVLGADRAADVRVEGPGVRPWHLRFVPTDGVVRVEPVVPGAAVEVNGESLFGKDLRDGDVILVGAVRVRWVDPPAKPAATSRPVKPAAPPFRPPAAATSSVVRAPDPAASEPRTEPSVQPVAAVRHRAEAKGRARRAAEPARAYRSRRSSSGANAAVVFAAVALVLLGVYGAVQSLRGSSWPSSPQHFVDLARQQLENHHPDAALATLQVALRDATGATRDAALKLEADIRRTLIEVPLTPKISAARSERDLVQAFASRWLANGSVREPARELVRRCDQWLTSHRDVCQQHSDGKELLRSIEDLRTKHRATAAMDTPETAADVLFVVQERLSLRWRDYRSTMARLDAFLQQQPEARDVAAKKAEVLRDGETWLKAKLDNLGRLLENGDVVNARRDLEDLERKSVLPQWDSLVAPLRARVAAAK